MAILTYKDSDNIVNSLERIANLAEAFADQIKPDCEEDQEFLNSYR